MAAHLEVPLVAAFDAPHAWKIEVCSYDPAVNPYASDVVQAEMEVVAVTLACAPSGRPRVDRCVPAVLASTGGTWTLDPSTGAVTFQGQVSERPVSAGSGAGDYTTETAVAVKATLDAGNRPQAVEARATFQSTGLLYGFRQWDTWLTPADPATATPPGPDPRQGAK